MDRRSFLLATAGGSVAAAAWWHRAMAAERPAGAEQIDALELQPDKVLTARQAMRPPNQETPIELFDTPITPDR